MAVVAAAFSTPQASAAVPAFPDACGSANNLDYATCERLDFIAIREDDTAQNTTLIWWGVWTLCGLVIVLLIAPIFVDAFRFWR